MVNMEDEKVMTRILTLDDLNDIMKVENETWIPPMRATREKIEDRINNGHRYFGYIINDALAGMVAWSYQNIRSLEEFPKDFSSFSSGKSTLEGSNSAFIYNVGVAKNFQGKGVGTKMVKAALDYIKRDGVNEVYLDGRCPSYNGSTQFSEEKVAQSAEFKKSIDICVKENRVPIVNEVCHDPTLRFYNNLNFQPVLLTSSGFITADQASGGYRVIMYTKV